MFEIEDRARPTIHGEERSVSSNLPFGINEMRNTLKKKGRMSMASSFAARLLCFE